MNKRLIVLVLLAIVLIWKFALSPSKLEFTDRVKILQGLNFAAEHKEAIAEYWKKNGKLPGQAEWENSEINIRTDFQKSLIESIAVGEEGPGVISISYTNARDNSISSVINGKKLFLVPEINGDVIDWSCKGSLPPDFLPRPCR